MFLCKDCVVPFGERSKKIIIITLPYTAPTPLAGSTRTQAEPHTQSHGRHAAEGSTPTSSQHLGDLCTKPGRGVRDHFFTLRLRLRLLVVGIKSPDWDWDFWLLVSRVKTETKTFHFGLKSWDWDSLLSRELRLILRLWIGGLKDWDRDWDHSSLSLSLETKVSLRSALIHHNHWKHDIFIFV